MIRKNFFLILLLLFITISCKRDDVKNLHRIKLELIHSDSQLNTFGNSHTFGTNESGNISYSMDNRLLTKYRWVNQLSSKFKTTLKNYGISGSKISFVNNGDSVLLYSVFNMTGNLEYNWTGVTTFMPSFNNLDIRTNTTSFYDRMGIGYEALIARSIIENYCGVGVQGRDAEGNIGTFEWMTNGEESNMSFPLKDYKKSSPFPVDSTNADRLRTLLYGGKYAQITLREKKAVGIFYDLTTDGQPFEVYVNDKLIAKPTSRYVPIIHSADFGIYPGVFWIENLPSNATIKVVAPPYSGGLYLLGFGFTLPDKLTKNKSRIIIFASDPSNNHNNSDAIQQSLASRAALAVITYKNYPVYFANTNTNWIQLTDSDWKDPAHLTPTGNEHVFQSFIDASKLLGDTKSNNFLDYSTIKER